MKLFSLIMLFVFSFQLFSQFSSVRDQKFLDDKLIEAVGNEDGNSVKKYLELGANPNKYLDGYPLLQYAIKNQFSGISLSLIQYADLNQVNANNKKTALMYAVVYAFPSWILSKNINVNQKDVNGNTALHFLIANDDTRNIQQFFQIYDQLRDAGEVEDLNINSKNNNNCTPLNLSKTSEVAKFLKKRGAKKTFLGCKK